MADEECVSVAVRMRPFNQREKDANATRIVRMKKESKGSMTYIEKADGSERKYEFDYSFQTHSKDEPGIGDYADQNTVFSDLGMPVLNGALEGKNTCLFAYGQTGAGKSFSMLGKERSDDPDLQGIIPRTCHDIFRRRDEEKGNPLVEYGVYIQTVEIYCEQINDLLAPRSTWPKHGHKPVFLGPTKGYSVETMKIACSDYNDIQNAFDTSNKNRSIGAHALNGESSRAHTIYMLTYRRTEKTSEDATNATTITSMINLVDLAGSERCDKAGTAGTKSKFGGDMLLEGNAINKSLSALGNCIKVLSEGKRKPPFKESKLTLLLQGAMTNGKVVMIAAVSPASICVDESISTLEFAKRIKLVKIKASKNVSVDPLEELQKEKDAMEAQMQAEIDKLKKMLAAGGQDPEALALLGGGGSEKAEELEKQLQEEREQQAREMEEMKANYEKMLSEERERLKSTPQERAALARKETMRHQAAMAQEFDRNGMGGGKPTGPHLANVNEDPRLCGNLTFELKAGANLCGMKSDPAPAIQLAGMGIVKNHAKIDFDAETEQILLTEVSPQGRLLVNGKRIVPKDLDEPRQLVHNTRLWFGANYVFVVQWPGQEGECEPGTEDGVSYEFAMNEAQKLAALDQEKDAATASGDFAKAQALQGRMQSFHRGPAAHGGPTIAELEAAQSAAIANEDYEEAGRIKRLLEAAAPSVTELEQRKAHAIANEDYQEAKRLTELIAARQAPLGTKGSWRAKPRLHSDPAGNFGQGGPDARDGALTARDYAPAQMMMGAGGAGMAGGPSAIPMTARTQKAFQQKMMFVGRAAVSLEFLIKGAQPSKFMTLPLEVEMGIELDSHVPPQLAVNVYQMHAKDQPQKRFAVGERCDFVVHVIGAKGIPEMFSHTVFTKYIFKWGERDSYKTAELKNVTEPNFDFKKRFAFPKMTETLQDWFCQEGVLTFEVIGIGQMR